MAEVQSSISESPRGFHQFGPSIGTHNPVDEDTPALLKGSDGFRGGRSETAQFVVNAYTERAQPGLNIGHFLRGVALAQQDRH
jgi:hypothetical protein